jgi:uncharacterized membrane protein YfcA
VRDLNASDLDAMLLLVAAGVVGGFVRGFSGFGGPTFISLLLTQVFTPISLIPKLVLMELCAYPALFLNVRKEVVWRLVLPLGSTVLVATPIGVWSMLQLDQDLLKRMIAAVALASVVALMAGWRLKKVPSTLALVPIGLLLGWNIGATYVALPMVAFMLMQPISAQACRANIIFMSIFTSPILLASVIYNDLVAVADLAPVFAAGLVYLGAVWLGARVFKLVGDRDYRRAAYWLMILLAIGTLLR